MTESKTINNVSQRELEVLHLIAAEYTSKEIANKLFISTETVNSHRTKLKNKLGAKNTAGLITRSFQHKLINQTISYD